jgi:hypothetical protein
MLVPDYICQRQSTECTAYGNVINKFVKQCALDDRPATQKTAMTIPWLSSWMTYSDRIAVRSVRKTIATSCTRMPRSSGLPQGRTLRRSMPIFSHGRPRLVDGSDPFHARDLIRLREWRAMPLSSLGYLLLWSLATRGDLFSLHLQLPLAQVRTLCPGWSSRKLRYLQCNEIATAWKEAENDANTDVGLWGAGSSGTHVHGAGPDGLAKLQS